MKKSGLTREPRRRYVADQFPGLEACSLTSYLFCIRRLNKLFTRSRH